MAGDPGDSESVSRPLSEKSESFEHGKAKNDGKGISPKVFWSVLITTCAITLAGSFLFSLVGTGLCYYMMKQGGLGFVGDGETEKPTVVDEREVIVGASLSGVVGEVADSVVELSVTSSSGKSAGSGVILRQKGNQAYVVTNFHVAGNSTSVTATLTNGNSYACTYLDDDTSHDIALIRMENVKEKLTVATIGNSDSLAVGDRVLAIGNPLGELGGTVTDGIVSALKRRVIIEGYNMELLQTNAAVNPGNSGGGLFNMAGELIGIVNAKESDTGIEGLAFAIPINNVLNVLNEIMDEGYVHGKLTLGFSLEYTTITVPYYGIFTRQVQCFRVVSTEDGTFSIGDIIYELNGVTLNKEEDLDTALAEVKEGDSITVKFYRDNLTEEHSAVCTCHEYIPAYLRTST